MDEAWIAIRNTGDKFWVSNFGNVRYYTDKENYKTLHPTKDRYGYFYLVIGYLSGEKRVAVHRLVASSFIDNPFNCPIVHHIDNNKENNRCDNLLWCTYAQNHSFRLLSSGGENRSNREILQYSLSGDYIATWHSFKDAYHSVFPEKDSALSNQISKCCRGIDGRKSAYGYIWQFGRNDPKYFSGTLRPHHIGIPGNYLDLFAKAYSLDPNKTITCLSEILKEGNKK